MLLLLPSRREGRPPCADREQLILHRSLSLPDPRTHQLPTHMRPICRMDITFCAHSRAAHLDPSTDGRQGRGVNWSSSTVSYVRVGTKWLVSQIHRLLACQSPAIKPGYERAFEHTWTYTFTFVSSPLKWSPWGTPHTYLHSANVYWIPTRHKTWR